ncbi:MAG: hypothetical protein EXS64_15285 [Candidatus Latescibacteria bacterium]|nr:hypothetical protein [Candidatus Latescibacterota bacterium]
MIDVFIAFDVEDPVNPESDDAVMRLARDLADVGVPGCFFLVGEKARVLRERGRRDVIEALAEHEIDYHGNYWFEFPELAMVYGERLSWDEGVQKALSIELQGLNQVAEITGQFPTAWVQHQGNTSPQTAYALRQAGVKCWNGGFGGASAPLWVMDIFAVPRAGHAVSIQGRWGGFHADPAQPDRRPPACDPDEEFEVFQGDFEKMIARGVTHVVCLGHPTCWVTAEWWGWYDWGGVFRQRPGEAPYPRGRQFERAPLRSPQDSEAHFAWTKRAARWMASRKDVRVTTFGQVAREQGNAHGQWLSRADLRGVAGRLAERLDWVEAGEVTLSAADALYVLSHAATFLLEHHRIPDAVQVMRVLGPTEPVFRPSGGVALKRQNLLVAARDTYHQILNTGRLPGAIKGHHVEMGPAELARALGIAWGRMEETGAFPEQVEVPEGPGLPAIVEGLFFRQPRVNSTNAPPGFRNERLPEFVQWQSWSYRPSQVKQQT